MHWQKGIRAATGFAVLMVGLAFLLVAIPSPAAEMDRSAPPRTSDGRPDLAPGDGRNLTRSSPRGGQESCRG